MDKIINVGLAGFGVSGQVFNAPFINADKRFCLKKCYERSTDKCREEYPYVETVRDFEDLLTDDIDIVVISLPNALHYPLAKKAIEYGKNIIVEKPVAASSKEAEELCELARDAGVLFTVNQNRRLDGDFLTVKKVMESGKLGKITDYKCNYERYVRTASSKPWKVAGGKGIDILYDLGVHIIDQAYYLFGMPSSVYGNLRKIKEVSSGCDAFEVSLYYPDNLLVTLTGTETAAIKGPHYALNGTDGSFVKYGMDVQEDALRAGLRPTDENWGKDKEKDYGTLRLFDVDKLKDYKIETVRGNYGNYYDNIYRAITRGDELLVKPEETVDVLKIIEAVQQSSVTGKRISLQ